MLKSEGEDAYLNGSREYINSNNRQSAHGLINSFFSSHSKETWVNKNWKQIRYSYIAMKGKGYTPAHFSTSEATGYGMRLAIYGYKGFSKVTSQGMGFAKS